MKKRILWISDIHLNQEPSADSTQVISSFINSLNQFDAIDYLVISGDVAQSGSEEAHYMQFESKFIAPFKLKFPNAKVFSVPGNHDVDWKWAEFHLFKEVIAAKEPVNLFEKEFNKKFDRQYYKDVFRNYHSFHDRNCDNQPRPTFSNLFSDPDAKLLFIFFNSAWLSIGKPINKLDSIKEDIIYNTTNSKVVAHKGEDIEKTLFSELGSQTYGFSLEEIKPGIDAISAQIDTEFSDYFKILVVHHPPNNWLRWEELYSATASNSYFHNFIRDRRIDVILAGHEHTSLVEGGLIYGRALVLHGGMFLDHHEKKYENLYYKTLDIWLDADNNGTSIDERWFKYSDQDLGRWREETDDIVRYTGWQNVCTPIRHSGDLDSKPKPIDSDIAAPESLIIKPSNEVELKKIIEKCSNSAVLEQNLLELIGMQDPVNIIQKEGVKCFKEDKSVRKPLKLVFFVDNIDDFFVENLEVPHNFPYLRGLIRELDQFLMQSHEGYEDIDLYVCYTYGLKTAGLSGIVKHSIQERVQGKFQQFRHVLFQDEECIKKLRNAKFSIKC